MEKIAAERNAELIVLDAEAPHTVTRQLAEDDWLGGGKPSEQFLKALSREYQEQAQTKIQQVEAAAAAKGIPVRSH